MDIPDEWANALEQECEHCGEVKPCLSAEDPFVADIFPEDENDESFWCQECWENRCDER